MLRKLNARIRADGGVLVVCITPNRDMIEARMKNAVRGEKISRDVDYDYFYRRIRDIGRLDGFDTLDLYSSYASLDLDILSLYLKTDMHWNKAGHYVTARIVADYLRQNILKDHNHL